METNNKKQLTIRPQSLFTMVVEFSSQTLYFGTHKKFTFRGDDLTNNPQDQVKMLKIKRQELLERYKLFNCTIYDNRSISNLPFCIVKQWYHLSLRFDHENLLYLNDHPQEITIGKNFIQRMIKENFLSHEQ